MKGKILDYNVQEAKGIISADDGKRYNFTNSEWKSDNSPRVNQKVDFEIDGENAKAIYAQALIEISGEKNKIIAGALAIFLGGFGVHKFYIGCNKAGIIMLLVFILGFILLGIPSIIIGIIALIEGLIYLFKSDKEFTQIYETNKKCWF